MRGVAASHSRLAASLLSRGPVSSASPLGARRAAAASWQRRHPLPPAAAEGSRSLATEGGGALPSHLKISESRLQQFLQAEVSFFANQAPNSISLRQIIDASTPESAARLSHEELPIRFAQRIRQIEELPGWDTSKELREVHEFYTESFRDLRLIDINSGDLDAFHETVKELKGRMSGVIPRLATSMRELQHSQGFSEVYINEWLDSFLLSRIGTEMLTSQYMACAMGSLQTADGSEDRPVRTGIVDNACDPTSICEQAAKHARRLCRQHCRSDVRIVVESSGDVTAVDGGTRRTSVSSLSDIDTTPRKRIRFPYVPQYLFYIMVELLKNSARATVESCDGDMKRIRERPIVVTVGADPSQVGIRVDDLAGGIPFHVADSVWSYMYTTVKKQDGAAATFTQEGTPLAGYGVGLPLSRLYARYLGGSLHLMSLPGIGTSAYLYLKRVESEAREALPNGSARDGAGAWNSHHQQY
eukprot:TRINITY_DN92398_c0_g1_i1.p1 TRINITY_DN92398_c0_g1~~TRINITY_DN92398_c0_g1_i1.p1  ORF type:complete len:473 (+),score=94.09 TRINITY_DN92398_c0_g1_i1:55-1473(+)